MRIVSLIFSVCLTQHVVAQDIQTTPPVSDHDSVRSYYIQVFPDKFFVYPVLKQRSLNFELAPAGSTENVVAFKPNNSYSFGVGLYLFELGFELALAVPLDEKSISIYGESDARDIQLNVLGKRWGLDAFYQRYSGFYTTDPNTEILDGDPYPQRSDIVSRNLGLTGNYIFNNEKFSFRSAYNFAERQLFSKGSVLISSSLSTFRLEADSSIITPGQQTFFETDVSFTNLRYTSFSIAPGYTYSIVFKNFFLNGALSIGPSHHWIRYSKENSPERNETTVNSFIAARIALGYNGTRIFGGISFLNQGSKVKFEDAEFSNNNGSFKILMGYRFTESGFLKRRAWDLVPFRI
jgi:hypothetical protein